MTTHRKDRLSSSTFFTSNRFLPSEPASAFAPFDNALVFEEAGGAASAMSTSAILRNERFAEQRLSVYSRFGEALTELIGFSRLNKIALEDWRDMM